MNNSCDFGTKKAKKESNPLVPVCSGEEICESGHYWGAGVRSIFLIHYVVSGSGVFYCGPNKYTLREGQAFIIFPDTIVKYQADKNNPWHYAWVGFQGNEAKDILEEAGITLSSPVFEIKDGIQMLELIRGMPKERSANMRENLLFISKLYEFMSVLFQSMSEMEDKENIYLTTATRYIKAHYSEDITVEQVASHVGISRKYLFVIFKNSLDLSPKDYIIGYRMKRAMEFLRNENLPIASVAYSVGYKDPLTFSKIFKLKTGLSPSKYRKNIKERHLN